MNIFKVPEANTGQNGLFAVSLRAMQQELYSQFNDAHDQLPGDVSADRERQSACQS